MTNMKRILVTPGEPAGIGPDIVIEATQHEQNIQLIAIADPELLMRRAKLLSLPLKLHDWKNDPDELLPVGHLYIIPINELVKSEPGELNPGNAEYVLRTLEIAATLCLEKKADAIVTGPVHKSIMNRGGVSFIGHTEYFARIADVPHTVMLFVIGKIKVALATTHLPLHQVSASITKELLQITIAILQNDLQNKFKIAKPKIYVCGLNPHAGEGGYLGREEIDVISPVISQLQNENYQITGPLPADTIFTPNHLQNADVILAMYHDQALPLVKYIGFGQAVNVTLGLPFVRTSVDHGTAIDIAGSGKADAGSILKAIELAAQLIH